MINGDNPKYIQHLQQYLHWLVEYMRLNFRNYRGLV